MYIFNEIANKINNEIINNSFENTMQLNDIQKSIVKTIQSRLYNFGIDATGKKINTDKSNGSVYSAYTKKIKKQKKQSIENVTFKDTGEFYNSFEVIVNNTFYQLKADFEKENSNIFYNFQKSYSNENDFENAILNLNENEFNYFIQNIFLPEFQKNFKKNVQL